MCGNMAGVMGILLHLSEKRSDMKIGDSQQGKGKIVPGLK
jgi:hypothetical protein